MKEIVDIVRAYSEVGEAGPSVLLATLLKAHHGACRREGARMLLIEGGQQAGMLCGRGIEKALHERARTACGSGQPELFRFVAEESSPGAVSREEATSLVLLEPLSGRPDELPVRLMRDCLSRRVGVSIALAYAVEGSSTVRPGSRWMIDGKGRFLAPEAPSELTALVNDALLALPPRRTAQRRRIEAAGVCVDLLLERLVPPLSLVVFGGGLDVRPLVSIAGALGWHAVVADADPSCANRGRFPQADEIIVARVDEMQERVKIDPQSVVVLATHNFEHDEVLLDWLVDSPARYIGVPGPPSRCDELLVRLREADPTFEQRAAGRLHAPAGLPIGAKTAEETALAVLAEIRAFLEGRTPETCGAAKKTSGATS